MIMESSAKSVTFQVDHLKMERGIYVPLCEKVGGVPVLTYDIRVRKPYADAPMTESQAHTVEHMLATGLRQLNVPGIQVIYFGPMGCMTGFYLLLAGEITSVQAAVFIRRGVENALAMPEVPANNKIQCGNCLTLGTVDEVREILNTILSFCKDAEETGEFSKYIYLD